MSHDVSILGRLLQAVSGTCRVCGCHGDTCRKPDGDTCGWMDDLKTLCSRPGCIIAAEQWRKTQEREMARRAQQAKRDAEIPQWMRVRKENNARHRRAMKAKGRAA